MRPKDRIRASELERRLLDFSKRHHRLRGISRAAERRAFIAQLLDSLRRVRYVEVIRSRQISPLRTDPNSDLFDPLKASLVFAGQGELDEAFWMVFLFTHFGKHRNEGWLLARELYGGLGTTVWNWTRVSSETARFCSWLDRNAGRFRGKFGNHRKYESLRPDAANRTSLVVESYVDWLGSSKSHEVLLQKASEESGGTPTGIFDWLMIDMKKVLRFGRLARFDHLAMVGKLKLAEISPGSPYLQGATGPLSGAKLLFDNDAKSSTPTRTLDSRVVELGNSLSVGMQEMEDAMCNWQKSPRQYEAFRG